MERSEKYESEKAKADGPWGGWVGIPRQMKIEVGGSKVLWSRCSICRDVFVCLEAPASGSSPLRHGAVPQSRGLRSTRKAVIRARGREVFKSKAIPAEAHHREGKK